VPCCLVVPPRASGPVAAEALAHALVDVTGTDQERGARVAAIDAPARPLVSTRVRVVIMRKSNKKPRLGYARTMSVRPRRTFASSLVITMASTAALAVADDKQPTEPPIIHKNPPAPRRPPPPPPKQAAPETDRHWHVYRQDKTCFADNAADACPPQPAGKPVPPCNPPAPVKYACPANVTLPVNVVQRAHHLDCFVDYGTMSCPKDMACNPPPPKKLACPE